MHCRPCVPRSPARSEAGVAYAGLAVSPPCIGEKIISRGAYVPGVSRRQVSLGPAGGKGHHDDVLYSLLERFPGGAKIARVFSPERAQPRLHGIARGDAREPHSIALAETLPVRTVLTGTVHGRGEAGTEHAGGQANRPNRTFYKPVEPLTAGDRMIGTDLLDRHAQGQFGKRLDGTRLPERAHAPGQQNCSKVPKDNFHKLWLQIRTGSLPEAGCKFEVAVFSCRHIRGLSAGTVEPSAAQRGATGRRSAPVARKLNVFAAAARCSEVRACAERRGSPMDETLNSVGRIPFWLRDSGKHSVVGWKRAGLGSGRTMPTGP